MYKRQGERSLDYVELLCSHGYDAGNITGGYRAYLRLQLERFMKEEDARKEKTKDCLLYTSRCV